MYAVLTIVIPIIGFMVAWWLKVTPEYQSKKQVQVLLSKIRKIVFWIMLVSLCIGVILFTWINNDRMYFWRQNGIPVYMPETIQFAVDWIATLLCILLVPIVVWGFKVDKKTRIKKIQELKDNYY